ncbi:MAG: TonB family protein, partial [Adhaeribacter sp.]|nr:TonB family protein [Adhaeribacter sp.]
MRNLIFLIYSLTVSLAAFGQSEIEYFDQQFRLLPDKEGAAYYKTTQFDDKEKNSKTEITYFITGEKQAEIKYIKTPGGLFLPAGVARKWYKNGQLYYTAQYRQGKKEGEAVGYYASGKLKRREHFNNGKLDSGEFLNEYGTP